MNTGRPPGVPSRAGTSKASIARTAHSRPAPASAGVSSGRVTRRRIVPGRAPATAAASSCAASCAASAAATIRKTSGAACSPSATIIPPMPNTSTVNGSTSLSIPLRGLARSTQPIV